MRYFIELSYNGKAYRGWQRQDDVPTVQGTLEDALATVLRTEVPITGAGRTDTGVHARFYVAHIDLPEGLIPDGNLIRKINSVLPIDIAVHRIFRVADTAHARFDALSREYKYYITDRKDPFRVDTAWYYTVPLDVSAMNEAARGLIGNDDFTTFSKLHSGNRTNICRMFSAGWEKGAEGLIFTIRADRFLRNMVRSTVAALVDVGRGKITPARFVEILHARDRSLATSSAPAGGLFLTDVQYPETINNIDNDCSETEKGV